VAVYYLGMGLTWRFGGAACRNGECGESACSCQ
jgi:hypothetical protein